jgi:hypothetical protein
MSGPSRGYPSDSKGSTFRYQTVEQIRDHQQGASVISHASVRLVIADAVEAGSTQSVIVATAHVALPGDVINFTSGTQIGREVKVAAVGVNDITLVEDLPIAPVAADTFQILRHKYPLVDASGNIAVAVATDFTLDGLPQAIVEDTLVPANNRPQPVHILARPVQFVRNDYAITNVTTAAYVQLIAATASYVTNIDIFDSSGETLFLAFGAAAAEVDQLLITPGGVGPYNCTIPVGTRISVKAITATASVGEIDINLFR